MFDSEALDRLQRTLDETCEDLHIDPNSPYATGVRESLAGLLMELAQKRGANHGVVPVQPSELGIALMQRCFASSPGHEVKSSP